jgi:hypothetical protein
MELPDAQKKIWWLCSSLFTSMLVFVMVCISQQAGVRVASGKVFKVDWLWHGWVVRAYRTASEAVPVRT